MTGERLSAESIIGLLDLAPLPGEGGYFRQTYVSGDAHDPVSTAIYYLVTADSFSALHQLASDEMFHFYAADGCQMVQLDQNGTMSEHVIGMDLIGGERPQILVAGGIWQGTRLREGGDWALLGTTMTPGYTASDFQLGTIDLFHDCSDVVRARLAEFID